MTIRDGPIPHRVDDDSAFLFALQRGADGARHHGPLAPRLGPRGLPRRPPDTSSTGARGMLMENDEAWLVRPDGAAKEIPGDPPTAGDTHGGALLTGAVRQMETIVTSVRDGRDIPPRSPTGSLCQEVLHAGVALSRARRWEAAERVPG